LAAAKDDRDQGVATTLPDVTAQPAAVRVAPEANAAIAMAIPARR